MKEIIMLNIRVVKVVLIALTILNSNINAQWSNDPLLNNPICTKVGDQDNVKIVPDGFDGAIITWQDYQFGTTDIFAQKIDKYGYIKWTNYGSPLSDSNGDQINLEVVDDGEGGAICVWQDARDSVFKIYMDRIDSTGWHPWSDGGVLVCSLEINQTFPKVAKDGLGNFIITWIDKRTGFDNIFSQKINIDGSTIWSENGIQATYSTGEINVYKIKSDNLGGIFIVYEDSVLGHNRDIKSQSLNSAGDRIWGNGNDILVSKSNYSSINPDFIFNKDEKLIVVWSENRAGNYYNICAQKLNRDGNNHWSGGGTQISTSSGNQIKPKIAESIEGTSIITWEDYRDLIPKVAVQKLTTIGFLQWQNELYSIGGSLEQLNPSILADKFGNATIVWDDYTHEYGDIYSRKINSKGELGEIIPICTADQTQNSNQIISDGSDGLIAVWLDRRNEIAFGDIYCSQLDANGNLGAGQSLFGLIADYKFDGNANDLSNNNNNGIVTNAVLTTDRFGNSESAYEFDGTSYISIPNSLSLSSPKNELTQCAWISASQWGWFGDGYNPIITKSNNGEYTYQYAFGISQNYLVTTVNNWENSSLAPFSAELNKWYFVVSVIKNDTAKSYVDGNLIYTSNLLFHPINYDTKPLEIGRDMPGAEDDFFGKIDDVRIYNRALSQEEIQNLYQFGNTTSIENSKSTLTSPNDFCLNQNYPNPFNPNTKISWQTPVNSHQSLKVYDILGNEIATLIDEDRLAGYYEVDFDASKLSSGMYIYKLQIGEFTSSKKMILIK